MKGVSQFALILVLWASSSVLASSLSYKIEGVRSTLESNIVAWLGDDPQTPWERSIFLARLDERVSNGMQALGYYRAELKTHIDKSDNEWQLLITITLLPCTIRQFLVRI